MINEIAHCICWLRSSLRCFYHYDGKIQNSGSRNDQILVPFFSRPISGPYSRFPPGDCFVKCPTFLTHDITTCCRVITATQTYDVVLTLLVTHVTTPRRLEQTAHSDVIFTKLKRDSSYEVLIHSQCVHVQLKLADSQDTEVK